MGVRAPQDTLCESAFSFALTPLHPLVFKSLFPDKIKVVKKIKKFKIKF